MSTDNRNTLQAPSGSKSTVQSPQSIVHDFLSRLATALARLLYPPHCVVCLRPVSEDEDRYLCRDCIARIDYVRDPTCPKCGHELGPHVTAERRCAHCNNMPLRFDRAVAAAHHAGAARDMVLGLKFGARKHNTYPLSQLLAVRLADTDIPGRVGLIVPVPLHRSRLRTRGFNQAEMIARELGERFRLPVVTRNLRRIVNTPPQTRALSSARRRANVKGAFALKRPRAFDGKSVLLVDDVLTTGATCSECAGLLKRAGAARVYVATVTRRMLTPARPIDGDSAESSPIEDEPGSFGED